MPPISLVPLWDVSTPSLEYTCGKFNWLDVIWKGTHMSISGLAVEQKPRTMRLKELGDIGSGGKSSRLAVGRFDPTLDVSKCPWARHQTPNCSRQDGRYLKWQPIAVGVCVCVKGWIQSINTRQGQGDWSGLRESWTEKSTEISLMKTWSRALRTSEWSEGSPSNRTMTLSTQCSVHCTVRTMQEWLRDNSQLWMSLSGPASALS